MSNSIWKTGNLQKADTRKQILFFAGGGRFPYYGWNHPKQGFIGSWVYDDVQKWCYIDDLIAQADKAERLQKAVNVAILRLEQGKNKFGKSTMGPNKEIAMLCDIVIDEIKKLIKGE